MLKWNTARMEQAFIQTHWINPSSRTGLSDSSREQRFLVFTSRHWILIAFADSADRSINQSIKQSIIVFSWISSQLEAIERSRKEMSNFGGNNNNNYNGGGRGRGRNNNYQGACVYCWFLFLEWLLSQTCMPRQDNTEWHGWAWDKKTVKKTIFSLVVWSKCTAMHCFEWILMPGELSRRYFVYQ